MYVSFETPNKNIIFSLLIKYPRLQQLHSRGSCFFFFNDTATTEIYTLSLHDALPISTAAMATMRPRHAAGYSAGRPAGERDRKSTRLNSSHANISYAVFCLKKKKPTHPSIQL